MNKKLKTTITKLAPAVFISLIATSLGLLSLFNSQVPMIQDFGMMLAIGIAVAFLLALFVLLPVLVTRDKLMVDNNIEKSIKSSIYSKLMKKMTYGVYKTRYFILIIAVLSAGIGFYFDQEVGVETDFETFMPQDSDALTDIRELRTLIGSTDRIVILYHSDNIESFSTIEDVDTITTMIMSDYSSNTEMIASVSLLLDQVSNNSWDETNLQEFLNLLPEDQLRLLQDNGSNQGIINISLSDMNGDDFEIFIHNLEDSISELNIDINYTITGQSIVDQEMLSAMTSDRLSMTLIGIGLVFVALLILYRNLFKALLSVLPIILIVGWSGGLMYLFSFDYTPLTSTLGALIIGIGTEFTILILSRFNDYKKEGMSHKDSIIQSIASMSKPIIVSAVTTIGGFSALIFSDFEILSNFGIMTVVNISLALISSLIVLPALLAVVGQQAKELSS